ncbi:MAG: helix-turn-helix domain-containing protein [Gammaproteobacteria bacterium]|nr:helix-turn-helix domain-containing protein [Gammaproteobacteria bacterium]
MLLTVKQAALELAISSKQLRRHIDAGALPVIRLGRTARGDRVDPVDLNKFAEGQRKCRSANDETAIKSMCTTVRSALDAKLGTMRKRASLKVVSDATSKNCHPEV